MILYPRYLRRKVGEDFKLEINHFYLSPTLGLSENFPYERRQGFSCERQNNKNKTYLSQSGEPVNFQRTFK